MSDNQNEYPQLRPHLRFPFPYDPPSVKPFYINNISDDPQDRCWIGVELDTSRGHIGVMLPMPCAEFHADLEAAARKIAPALNRVTLEAFDARITGERNG